MKYFFLGWLRLDSNHQTIKSNLLFKLYKLFEKMSAIIALSSNPTVPRRIIQGKRTIEYNDRDVSYLLTPSNFATINLRPRYQRQIRWKPEAMNSFIDSVFKGRYIMPVLMYALHPEDLTGRYTIDTNYESEVLDGQHRLWTLNAFRTAKLQKLPNVKKPFIVYWDYVDETADFPEHQCVFYEQTDDVENWCKETGKVPQFLSKEEKRVFDKTVIKVATITSRLTIEERRQEFISLQNGVPVRNSDLLKNMTKSKLISFCDLENYEEMMDTFYAHCSKKADLFRTNWVVRCFLLFEKRRLGELNEKSLSQVFLTDDAEIGKMVKNNLPILNPSDEVLNDFDDIFKDFISFLQRMDDEQVLNPTQIFALFHHLCEEGRDLEVLKSHIPLFSKEGKKKDVKSLWKSAGNTTERRKYFEKCVSQLVAMVEPAQPIDERPITKKLKAQVWKKCADKKCECCRKEITKTSFEAGHIKARAKGGPTEIDNLVAICFDCNRRMGTSNLYEYKQDVYPTTTTTA